MARRVLEHHVGTVPDRLVHQPSGETNVVFVAEHRDGDLVVRLGSAKGKLETYRKEQWACARARAAGVPTADILFVGDEAVPYAYMVSRRVAGTEATRHTERRSILRELGRYAAVIHSIPTRGFGHVFDWAGPDVPRHDSWRDFLEHELRLEEQLELLHRHGMLQASQLADLRTTLEAVRVDPTSTVLNHGDLRLKNVLVDAQGAVAAIIDWEHCTSSSAPAWDLSIALHDLSIDEKEALVEGYGLDHQALVELAPVMRALNIVNYAPYVALAEQAGDTDQLENFRIRLRGTLDLFAPTD
jgi:hygromycin-B 4-O-kinase